MPRRNELPDPDDRSANQPSVIVSPKTILDVVNKDADAAEAAKNVTTKVQEKFRKVAEDAGWGKVESHGNQAVLTNTKVTSCKSPTET